MTPDPIAAIERLRQRLAMPRDATYAAPRSTQRVIPRREGTVSSTDQGNLVMGLLDRHAPGVHDAIRGAQRGLRGLLRPRGETGERMAMIGGLLGLSDPMSAIDGPARAVGMVGRTARALDKAEDAASAIRISDPDLIGASGGQQDLQIVARTQDGRPVGIVDYSIYDGEILVKHVEVLPEMRRQGIASSMYGRLVDAHPDARLVRATTTPEGTAFRDAWDARLR